MRNSGVDYFTFLCVSTCACACVRRSGLLTETRDVCVLRVSE